MVQKIRFWILMLFLAATCSSCFEIIEEIVMKTDGSGNMVLTLNMSQSKTKLASVMLMDSINGYKVPSKQSIQKEIAKSVTELKAMPGVSNVKSSSDFNNFIVTISFDFKDLSNINNITKKILEGQKIKQANVASYTYNKTTKTFAKAYQYSATAKSEYNKLKQADRNIFQNATYTSIYRFENIVASNANTEAKISKSQKAVMHKVTMLDLINGKASLANKIQLKP